MNGVRKNKKNIRQNCRKKIRPNHSRELRGVEMYGDYERPKAYRTKREVQRKWLGGRKYKTDNRTNIHVDINNSAEQCELQTQTPPGGPRILRNNLHANTFDIFLDDLGGVSLGVNGNENGHNLVAHNFGRLEPGDDIRDLAQQ